MAAYRERVTAPARPRPANAPNAPNAPTGRATGARPANARAVAALLVASLLAAGAVLVAALLAGGGAHPVSVPGIPSTPSVVEWGLPVARTLTDLDTSAVDRTVSGSGTALAAFSARARRAQTGFVRSYALSMLGGTFLVVGALLLVRFV